eukprot:9716539-Prorocentrum_lima.AAC.1
MNSTEPNEQNQRLEQHATRARLEKRQRDGLRRHLASNIRALPGNFEPGDIMYYREEGPLKIKQGQ